MTEPTLLKGTSMATNTKDTQDDTYEAPGDTREAEQNQREEAEEKYGETREDLNDPTYGWTVQQGGLGPKEPAPQQYYTPDQAPDPSAVDNRWDLGQREVPEHLVVGGVEGTGFVDWTDEDGQPLAADARETGPLTVGDRPTNFLGRSADWTDPNVGWTVQKASTDFRMDYLQDPQTKGLFPHRIFKQAELPDATVASDAGFAPLPGVHGTEGEQGGASPAGSRHIQSLVWYSDDDAELTGHPRGPEPLTQAARAATRNAIKTRLNSEVGYSDIVVEAGADQTVAQGVYEVQTVTITGTPTGGTFTLTFDGETTAAVDYDATAAEVATALEALDNIDDVVTAGGPFPGTAVTVEFVRTTAGTNDVAQMTATSSLTGGTSPAVAVTTTTAGTGAVTLAGSASGVSGATYSYAWTQTAGVDVTLSDPDIVGPAFGPPDSDTTLVFELNVEATSDAGGAGTPKRTGSDRVTITVGAGSGTPLTAGDNDESDPEDAAGADASSEGGEAADAPSSDAEPESYEEMTKEQLTDIARDRELSGYSTLNKAELVDLIEEDDKNKG